MPKEQLTNFRFVSPECDVWSLGAIVYECLSQKLPRPIQPRPDPIKVILASEHVSIDVLLPDFPEQEAQFIMKALAAFIVRLQYCLKYLYTACECRSDHS